MIHFESGHFILNYDLKSSIENIISEKTVRNMKKRTYSRV